MEELKSLERHIEWKKSVYVALVHERESVKALISEFGLSLSNALHLLRKEIDKVEFDINEIERLIEIKKEEMNKMVKWVNEETELFYKNEGEQVQYAVQVGMTLDEMKDLVYTHISFLAEDESLNDITREFAQAGFDKVDTDQVAEVLYNDLKESYELS